MKTFTILNKITITNVKVIKIIIMQMKTLKMEMTRIKIILVAKILRGKAQLGT
jgi:hypothetical protein